MCKVLHKVKGTVLINGRCIAIHGDIKAGTIAKLQTWEAERVINKVHPGPVT